MSNLILIEPSKSYQKHYIEMIEDWKTTGEKKIPFVLAQPHNQCLIISVASDGDYIR